MIKLFEEINPADPAAPNVEQDFSDSDHEDPFENAEDPFEDASDPFGDGTIFKEKRPKLNRAMSLEYLEKVVEISTISIEERLKSEKDNEDEQDEQENIDIDAKLENEEKEHEKVDEDIEEDKNEMDSNNQIKEPIGLKRNYLKALHNTPPSSPCKKVMLSTYITIQWPVEAKLFQRGERIYYSRVIIGGEDYRINDSIQFINFNLSEKRGYIGRIKSLYCNESSNPYEYKNFVSCQFYFYPSELASQNSDIISLQDISNPNELILSDGVDVFSIDLISKKVNVLTFEEFKGKTDAEDYFCNRKYDFLSKTFV
jgi:hypothetical protein